MFFDRHFAGMHGQALDRAAEARLFGDVHEQIVDRRGADFFEHRTAIGVGQG